MSWLTGNVVKLIGGALAMAAIGAAAWYFIHVIHSEAACQSDKAQLVHAASVAAEEARTAQKKADQAAIDQARALASQALAAASSAKAAILQRNRKIDSLTHSLAAAEAKSPSAAAQGHECLDPAIRQSQGFKEKCP